MDTSREANAALNHQEYEARAIQLESYPTMVFVELTQNCNLSCVQCRSAGEYDGARDMPLDLFETVARTLFPRALLIGLNGWGESTILRDFPDRLRMALDSGARVRLVTNGHAMTPALWRMFFEGDHIVVVSLDSADPTMFDRLGRGNFELVRRNLERGVEIRNEQGRGTIDLNVVLNSYTASELPNIVRFCAELGLAKVVVNPLKAPTTHPAHLSHSREPLPDVLDASASLARQLGVTLQLGGALAEHLVVDAALPDVCENPWTNVLVGFDGAVTFCHHLLNAAGYTVGSLRDSPIEEIWNGSAFQQLRRLHIEAEGTRDLGRRFSKCTWCYHNRYSDAEFHTEVTNGREVSSRGERALYELHPERSLASEQSDGDGPRKRYQLHPV